MGVSCHCVGVANPKWILFCMLRSAQSRLCCILQRDVLWSQLVTLTINVGPIILTIPFSWFLVAEEMGFKSLILTAAFASTIGYTGFVASVAKRWLFPLIRLTIFLWLYKKAHLYKNHHKDPDTGRLQRRRPLSCDFLTLHFPILLHRPTFKAIPAVFIDRIVIESSCAYSV